MFSPILMKLMAEARVDDFRRAAAGAALLREAGAAPARAAEAADVARRGRLFARVRGAGPSRRRRRSPLTRSI
jgi:hypothetical protein